MKYLASFVVALFLFGCAEEIAQTETATEAPPMVQDEEASDLADLETRYREAKAAYELDGSMREEYVDAAVAFGTATMYGPGDPPEKYPLALRLYAEALELNPDNEEALKNRQMILEIYESMGRTPPGE